MSTTWVNPTSPTLTMLFGIGGVDMFYPVPVATPTTPRIYPDTISLGGRPFTINTSFEPYRREAFRHRTILPQRQSINFENIAGYGTLNTEGLWRRDQLDWSEGAGQQFLDRKTTSSASRFLSSQGVNPWFENQLTLLNDTAQRTTTTQFRTKAIAVNASACIMDGVTVTFYSNFGTEWGFYQRGFTAGLGDTILYNHGVLNPNISSGALISGAGIPTGTTVTSYDLSANTVTISNPTTVAIGTSEELWLNAPSMTTVTWPGDTPGIVFDICTDGHLVYVATDIGIFTVDSTAIFSGGSPAASVPATLYLATGAIQNYQAIVTGFTGGSGGSTLATNIGGVPSLIQPGMTVIGAGVPSGTTVVSVDTSSTTITLSHNLTAAVTATEQLTFDVTVGYTITAYTLVRICNNALVAAATNADTSTWTDGFTQTANCLLALTTVPTSTQPQAQQILMVHPNPYWVWSCAAGGATQIYVGGFDQSLQYPEQGAVYRSSMTGATAVTSVNQPFQLNYPVQTLPLEIGEYPTALYSYLNFIFLGTNLGIRMCQTLSVYDPSATQTGDLKAGPLAPNLLQPVSTPVVGIVGIGRFIYFSWGTYGGVEANGAGHGPNGIGRLDLTTSIGGDPLSLAYASDLMDHNTGPNQVNWLDIDPVINNGQNTLLDNSGYPMFSVSQSGVWSIDPTKYVSEGTINSGAITYGISDPKIPVQMDMSADLVSSQGIGIVLDMFDPSGSDIIIQPPNYQGSQVTIPNGARSERINVKLTLHSSDDQTRTPILYRYTLKSWPAATTETAITPVVTFGRNNLSGFQVEFSDPYENFWYLQQLLQNQTIVPYVEGPLSANVVVQELDWLPSKLQDNYEQGFVGDCVIYLKTIGGYSYTPTPTT